jgi:stearoyl-CoA desaturase (delta-9 desaturase)
MSSAIPPTQPHGDHEHDDIVYPQVIPFLPVHAECVAALWTGVTLEAVPLGIDLYWLRMFGITAGYHRYFSHRSYATSRVFSSSSPALPRVWPKRACYGGLPSIGTRLAPAALSE